MSSNALSGGSAAPVDGAAKAAAGSSARRPRKAHAVAAEPAKPLMVAHSIESLFGGAPTRVALTQPAGSGRHWGEKRKAKEEAAVAKQLEAQEAAAAASTSTEPRASDNEQGARCASTADGGCLVEDVV